MICVLSTPHLDFQTVAFVLDLYKCSHRHRVTRYFKGLSSAKLSRVPFDTFLWRLLSVILSICLFDNMDMPEYYVLHTEVLRIHCWRLAACSVWSSVFSQNVLNPAYVHIWAVAKPGFTEFADTKLKSTDKFNYCYPKNERFLKVAIIFLHPAFAYMPGWRLFPPRPQTPLKRTLIFFSVLLFLVFVLYTTVYYYYY